MMNYVSKPNLLTPIADTDNARFFRELTTLAGMGISVQTNRGRNATIRLNEDTWKLEATVDGGKTWRTIG